MSGQISLNYHSDSAIQPNILNQFDFKNAIEGVPAFFRNIKTFQQYGVSEAQKTLHNLFYNVTHVGLVFNSKDEEVCLAEALLDGVKINCYSSEDLVKTEICFPQQAKAPILKSIFQIARDKLQRTINYNFQGALQQPFIPKVFTELQKSELIERGIDHLLGGELIRSKDVYFCSEFVLETVQIAHLLNQIPELQKLIRTTWVTDPAVPHSRVELIQKIMNSLDVESIWKKISVHPLFHAPALATSPADLFAMYAQISPIICVSSRDAASSPCNSKLNPNGAECLEYLATRQLSRYFEGEKILFDDPGIQELISELSKQTNYSEQTLRCIFDTIQGDQEISTDDKQCLSQTLSYREQLTVFLLSPALSAAIDRLKETPSLLDRFQSSDAAVVKEAALEIFPMNPLQSKHFLINGLILLALQNKDPRFFLKNLPLSILHDKSLADKLTKTGLEKILPDLKKLATLGRPIFKSLLTFLR